MSAITYTANIRAPLIGGHTAGLDYSFDITFMAYEKAYNSPKKQHKPLDGSPETVLKRIDDDLFIEIGLYDLADEGQIEEFIKSVAGGETFTVDLYGTVAVPAAPVEVKLTSVQNRPTRHGPRTFSLGFNVLVV